jgi:hypothetical protein
MFGKLNEVQIDKLLFENFIGRIGCYANGKSYVVPISYAYDGKCIYAHTFEGLKVSMMRENPAVCFQVDRMKDMADWESVIAWGTYEELTNVEERNAGLKLLTNRLLPSIASETVKLSAEWPFPASDLGSIEGIVFRICLDEKSGRYEGMDSQAK